MADSTADRGKVLSAEADDHFHDECGVFGIFGRQDAAAIVTLGLHALQHRGQEAAGIVSYDGSQFHVERHVG
ncbi:amidophosphoribosyltransferase, partial [bacterium M00.F.Ca.ET.141.01.1.1]